MLETIRNLLTEDGRQEFIDLIDEIKKASGKDWLDELKDFSPEYFEIVDLINNHSFDEAFAIACKEYPAARLFRAQLQNAYEVLRKAFNQTL